MSREEWQEPEPMPTDKQQSEQIRQNEEVLEQPEEQTPKQAS